MKQILTIVAVALLALLAACGGTGATPSAAAPSAGGKTVTVYSADGLGDWYKTRFGWSRG